MEKKKPTVSSLVVTGTYRNFCFVTNYLKCGLFLVAGGQKMTGEAWVSSKVDKDKDRQEEEVK